MGKFLIGLIIGVSIAGGVVYYLNNTPVKFENKLGNTQESGVSNGVDPTILAPGTKIQETTNQSAPAKEDASGGDYDFYQILQDKNNKGDSANPIAKQESAVKTTTTYYIQAGVFSDLSAANNMQAQLALQGYEAKIRAIKSGTTVVNKVLMGPYTSENEVNNIRQELKSNGIKTTIIKLN